MKKVLNLVLLAFLTCSMVMVPVSVSAKTTASAKQGQIKTTYKLISSDFYKKAKIYHTKKTKVPVYTALISADWPKVTLTKTSTLKAKTNYSFTKEIKVKISNHKQQTYMYAKGHGWVVKTSLVSGRY